MQNVKTEINQNPKNNPIWLKKAPNNLKIRSKSKVRIERNIENTPTGASTNPNNFDLNKNLDMNLI